MKSHGPKLNFCPYCSKPRFSSTLELLEWAKRVGRQEMWKEVRSAVEEVSSLDSAKSRIDKLRGA